MSKCLLKQSLKFLNKWHLFPLCCHCEGPELAGKWLLMKDTGIVSLEPSPLVHSDSSWSQSCCNDEKSLGRSKGLLRFRLLSCSYKVMAKILTFRIRMTRLNWQFQVRFGSLVKPAACMI